MPLNPISCRCHVITLDIQAALCFLFVIGRREHCQKPGRRLESVAQTHRESLLRERSATSHGAQNDSAVLGQIHMDCRRLIVIQIKEFDIEGQ